MSKRWLTLFYPRVFFLFVVIAAGLCFGTQHQEALTVAKLKTLNRVRPSNMQYLIDLNRGIEQADAQRLDSFLLYYHTVEKFLPGSSDVYDALGFIYARLGQQGKAQSYFEQSVELMPHFFWSRYNLGVLYFRQGAYEKAKEQFQQALQSKPEAAILVFTQSKIYQQLFAFIENPQQQLQANMQSGFKEGYRLLVLANRLKVSGQVPKDITGLKPDWHLF